MDNKFDITDEDKKALEKLGKEAYELLSAPLDCRQDPVALDKLRQQACDTQALMPKLIFWRRKIGQLRDAQKASAAVFYGDKYRDKEISAASRDASINGSVSQLSAYYQQLQDIYDIAGKRLSLSQSLMKSDNYQGGINVTTTDLR